MDYHEKLSKELNHSFFCECLKKHDFWKGAKIIQVEAI
jgi:hypothetical protein